MDSLKIFEKEIFLSTHCAELGLRDVIKDNQPHIQTSYHGIITKGIIIIINRKDNKGQ